MAFRKGKRDYLSPSGSIWDLQKWISKYECSIGWLGSRSPPPPPPLLIFWRGLLNRCMYWVGHGLVRLCKLNYISEWLDSLICVYWSYFKPWKYGVQIWFCSRCPKKVEYILSSQFKILISGWASKIKYKFNYWSRTHLNFFHIKKLSNKVPRIKMKSFLHIIFFSEYETRRTFNTSLLRFFNF